jgi:two-component system, response regulator
MAGAKILVIEDNPSEVFLLRHALNETTHGADFELENLADGEDALEFIRNHWKNCLDFQPCMILLDLHLPKHDGVEILRAIREDPAFSGIPTVVMTNSASAKEAEELRALGVEYRLKPNDLAGFAKLASDLIEICKSSEVIA